MIYTDSRREQEFRDASKNPSMAGVMYVSWKCKLCKQKKPIHGRKSIGYKQGFACAECAKKL